MGRIPYGMDVAGVSEVRVRLLVHMNTAGLTYQEIAAPCGLETYQVRDFLLGKATSLDVVGAICDNLPLGLAYQPPRITFLM